MAERMAMGMDLALEALVGPEVAAQVRAAQSSSAPTARPPLYYLELPATATLATVLAEARRLFQQSPPLDPAQLRAARQKIQRIEDRLKECEDRDQIQATRPEGCWCLGWGGRNERVRVTPDGRFYGRVHDYCGCEDGDSLREEDEHVTAVVVDAQTERRRTEINQRLNLPPKFMALTLDGYPVSDVTRPAWDALTRWAREGLQHSAILNGDASTGKTGLAAAALHEKALTELRGGLYVTAPGLLRSIREGFNSPRRGEDGGQEDFFRRVELVPLLLLDDLGKEHATDWAASVMFELINGRHAANRPTLVTSNCDLDELGYRIGQPNLDRLQEMCGGYQYVFDFTDAPNLRLRGDVA